MVAYQTFDCFYLRQRDLSDEEASQMNCKLVILLANHIGDREALSEAIRLAGKQAG